MHDMHPDVAAVLHRAHRLQSVMDEYVAKVASRTFTAADDDRTVEVTLDGHHRATVVFPDLAPLDDDARRDRIGRASQRAAELADDSRAADVVRIRAEVAEIMRTEWCPTRWGRDE
ncbi:YbaB/EbfC family DNA-binding protein [Mycolicibacterium arenosum]|uniref:YbaB/EbfC family DNA-binding protein n=1 Tax=Mycolicibacterium arenosum TaxID=2952157 RepID=A0ABT1MCN8_9MYCO|nr:YbaB/EbfC family DNA-binding protein [Mycolicibacterium sp. CAU 1645]MCP9276943.1 YbaB/EbfC family DNA-binding protein [Mycolicibacterium sp. CAU 1645]